MGYIAGLIMRFNDLRKRVMLPVPGVGWWVKMFDVERVDTWGGKIRLTERTPSLLKFFDVEPRGKQKVMSNSPSVPLGGAAGMGNYLCLL